MYATSNIHSGHIQGPSAHTYTSAHTLIPRTEQFVHTGGVDTCIYYMYLLAFRSLPVPSAVALGLPTRSTPRHCITPAAGAAMYPVWWHEARSNVLSSRLLPLGKLTAVACQTATYASLLGASETYWRWRRLTRPAGVYACGSWPMISRVLGRPKNAAASGRSLGEKELLA